MRVEGADTTEYLVIETPLEQKAGNNGPQFFFRARIQAISQHPISFWVEQHLMPMAATAEQREKLVNTGHWVVVRKGKLKPPEKEGANAGIPKDPDMDWNYRYYIQQFDVPAPVGGNAGGGTRRTDAAGRSIERQVAFKGAIELAVAQLIEIAEIPDLTNHFADAIAGGVEEAISPAQAERLGLADLPPVDNSEGHMVRDAQSLGAVIIEEIPNEIPMDHDDSAPTPPPCATHGGAVFEHMTGRSGQSRWTHKKSDGGWCIFDGVLTAQPEPAELPDF